MRLSLRVSIAVLALAALVSAAAPPAFAQDKGGKLRFGVGPLQPTPSETTKAYEPFFAYVAKKLNREFDLVATTDFDRNRNAMMESGKLDKAATEVVRVSDPPPSDAIAVRNGFDPGMAKRLQEMLLGITESEANTSLPNHYTGFVGTSHQSYEMIEDALILVGRIKKP